MGSERRFDEFFMELDNGAFHDHCSAVLQELVADVEEIGRGGKLTSEIDIKKKSGHNVMVVTPKLKVKKPEADSIAHLFFVSPDNNLRREDPRQSRMSPVLNHNPSRTVSTPYTEVEGDRV